MDETSNTLQICGLSYRVLFCVIFFILKSFIRKRAQNQNERLCPLPEIQSNCCYVYENGTSSLRYARFLWRVALVWRRDTPHQLPRATPENFELRSTGGFLSSCLVGTKTTLDRLSFQQRSCNPSQANIRGPRETCSKSEKCRIM